jgi:GNAT superfamily N-acetyltransferase
VSDTGSVGAHQPRWRHAGEADLDELVRLHELARTHVGAQRGGEVLLGREVRPGPVAESFRAELDEPDRVVLLGCLGAVPVGLAAARVERLHGGERLAQVDELFVEADARDVGVGAVLMHGLLGWAREQGCSGIGSIVLPGDRDSKNFFESFGLVARAIAVHRDLSTS